MLGLIYCGRFLQGRWRHMRVIEPELLSADRPLGCRQMLTGTFRRRHLCPDNRLQSNTAETVDVVPTKQPQPCDEKHGRRRR